MIKSKCGFLFTVLHDPYNFDKENYASIDYLNEKSI